MSYKNSGSDGGLLSASTTLTWNSPTRYLVSGAGITITLPAANSYNNGSRLEFKNIGGSAVIWNVTGGGNVEGAVSWSDANFIGQGFPNTVFEVRNGTWWLV